MSAFITKCDHDSWLQIGATRMCSECGGFGGVVCEQCGSDNINFDGSDIDKCRDCRHWRYRGAAPVRSNKEADG